MKTDAEWLLEYNELYKTWVAEEMKDCYVNINNGTVSQRPREDKVGYVRNKLADYCEELILKAKSAYYETGEPIMSDKWYDKLENVLRYNRSDSKVLEKVGS